MAALRVQSVNQLRASPVPLSKLMWRLIGCERANAGRTVDHYADFLYSFSKAKQRFLKVANWGGTANALTSNEHI